MHIGEAARKSTAPMARERLDRMSDEITNFFEAIERNSASGDIDAMVAQFTDPFMSGDSTGVRMVQASEFRAALPKRKQLFSAIGCTSTKLVSVEETPLDDRYVMAKAVWRWEFPKPADPIVLPATYIIRKSGDGPRIVFYLTGDVMSVLRSRGLLPAATP